MTRNQLQFHANNEIARSNRVREAETLRSNLADEQERKRSNRANEELKRVANNTQIANTLLKAADLMKPSTKMENGIAQVIKML